MFRLRPWWPPVAIAGLLLIGAAAPISAQARDSATGPAIAVDVPVDVPVANPQQPLPASELQALGPITLPATGHEITVPLNQRVLSYIELFQGRLHEFIENGMRRGSKYLPMIQDVFKAQGLPLDLAYVPLIESAFRPDAVSRASAGGVWQFMKGTALENGLRHDWYIDERSNPEKATLAAANYLKTLSDTFGGDWQLALASYNSGPGRVQKALKRMGGDADFWSLAAKPAALPRETREYVPMILAAILIARNPAQYGFSFESEASPIFETVKLPRAVDLKRIAEWTGTPVATLKALNPELRRPMTPIKDAGYALRVPVGTSLEIARRMDEADGDDLLSLTRYSVKNGETLAGIARKLHISRSDLAEANDLTANARVSTGQDLIVPAGVPYVSYTPGGKKDHGEKSDNEQSRGKKDPGQENTDHVQEEVTRLLVASALAGTLVIAGHAQSQTPVDIVIRGRVVSVETGNALPHARVVIYNDATPLAPLFTDAQGRFASPPLATGRYRLTVTKSGYSLTTVARIDPASPDDLDVRMERSSAISGRVLDANGEPAIGVAVFIGTPRIGGSPSQVKTVGTDDLGEYRAGGLAPGTYVVGFNQLSVDATGGVTGALVFFPGASTAADAQAMTLAPGDQKTGIDFAVEANPVLPFALSAGLIGQPNARIVIGNPPANAATAPAGTSVIRGRVTHTDGTALAHVTVRAVYDNTGARTPVPPKVATTDDEGRYELTELLRGTYRVAANKPGYINASYGQTATDPPANIAVDDDQIRAQIDIALPKFGAISGQVVDDFGDPVEGVVVTASQIRFTNGRRRLSAGAPLQTTDDLGHYRVFSLPPGQYVLTAAVGQVIAAVTSTQSADIPGFAPTYFPGVTTANEARLVALGRGQDVAGIDVALIPLPTARINGRKLGSDGMPLGGSLVLIESQRSGAIVTPAAGARIEQDGRFEFPNVAPGEYVIQADRGKQGQADEGEFVSQFVSVNGADVTDVLLQATAGSSVSGHIVFDGDGDPPPLTFGVVPVRADADRTPLNGGNVARAEVQRDLSFAMTGIHGPRRLMIDRRPSGWDIEAVIADGVDVTDVALPFGTRAQSLSDVQVVLTNRLTEISGTVADARGQNVSDYAVLVFSSDRERWYSGSRFLRRGGPQAAGNFTVSGLPPGDYFVAAVSNTMAVLREGVDAWQDPEFLETISSRASRATLTDGQKLSVSARVITP